MQFDEGNKHIMAMRSLDGEVVGLRRQVQVVPEVEVGASILLFFFNYYYKNVYIVLHLGTQNCFTKFRL